MVGVCVNYEAKSRGGMPREKIVSRKSGSSPLLSSLILWSQRSRILSGTTDDGTKALRDGNCDEEPGARMKHRQRMTVGMLYRQTEPVIEKPKYGMDLVEWESTTCQWQRLLCASAPVPYVIMRAFGGRGVSRPVVATGSSGI